MGAGMGADYKQVVSGRNVFHMSEKMQGSIDRVLDACAGEEPSRLEQSRAANDRRNRRIRMREVLYRLVFLARREGREELAGRQRLEAERALDGHAPH